MKKASIVSGLLLMITATATFSQPFPATPEFFYGEIKAVNSGYYYTDAGIYCAVQVGTNESTSYTVTTYNATYPSYRLPILFLRTSNPLAKEIYTLLLTAEQTGQKVHMRTLDRQVVMGTTYGNEILEVSVGEVWQGWPFP
jgi:hypothetical protein